MHHERAEELMSLRLDGLLSEREEAALQAHLRSCQRCAQIWQRMSAVSVLLESQPAVGPGPGFVEQILEKARRRRRRARIGLWLKRFLAVLLGCLLMGGAFALSIGGLAAANPGLFQLMVDVAISLLTLGGALYDALEVVLRVTLQGPGAMLYVVWIGAAGLALGLWLLLVNRSKSVLQLQHAQGRSGSTRMELE